jgi:hypothetical protein
MNPYRESHKPIEKYPNKNRDLHKYVSPNDAYILDKLFNWWKPSEGYEVLAELLSKLEGSFAQHIGWTMFEHSTRKMISELMWDKSFKWPWEKEENNDTK